MYLVANGGMQLPFLVRVWPARFYWMSLVYSHMCLINDAMYQEGSTHLIGVSLSEPHTSESNGGFFIYISVIRRSVNAS